GYPAEMLDLDLDLEADLGIDTVKQAEVFASIRGEFGIARDDALKLRDYPTLNAVVDFVQARIPTAPAPVAADAPVAAATPGSAATQGPAEAAPAPAVRTFPAPPVGSLEAADRLPRRVPVPVLRPPLTQCKPTGVELQQGDRVLLAPDRGGVATVLTERLRARGVEVLTLGPDSERQDLLEHLESRLGEGAINGVYWLAGLDDEGPMPQLDDDGWRTAVRSRVKNLVATMRRLYDRDVFLITGTRLGGRHGYDRAGASAPLGGSITGFAKALKREKPDTLVKAVDFPLLHPETEVADRLIEETLRDPGCVEVGHDARLRWTVGLEEQPAADGQPGLALTPETVYVVTGAAGSIVSAITADLATAGHGGVFHLLDLTPQPDPDDPDLVAFLADREGLKRELIARLTSGGQKVTPVLVEKELARIERLAMAQAAISAVVSAGGVARYHSVDLTDGAAVGQVARAIATEHGRVDVLIHAAGLDISRALKDKEPREYDLVFDVKSAGWFHLLRALDGVPIAATVAFSSVAGRFGNQGQTDYSAANDLLCKLTSNLRRTRPDTRGIVIDWTAWAGIGMATRGSIPTVMAQAGIEMLDPAAGIATVRRELTAGGTRGELVVGGELGVLSSEFDPEGGLDPAAVDVSASGPMIGRVIGMGIYSGLTVETTLDPQVQPFLADHRIDGTAVLPGVMGVEAFAEAARLLLPDWHVAAIEDVDFLAPVKFYRDEPRTLTITATIRPDDGELVAFCRLVGTRRVATSPEPQTTVHFTGRVRLTAEQPAAEWDEVPAVSEEAASVGPESVYAIYFHGPAFQVLDRAWHTERSVIGRFAPQLPPGHQPADRPVLVAPRLIELCFQTAGVQELGAAGRMALPAHIDRIVLHSHDGEHPNGDHPNGDQLLARVDEGVVDDAADDAAGGRFNAEVLDATGRVQLRLEGYRTVALPAPIDDQLLEPLRRVLA
ncbi:MAG TPA: SDR family NAD(P)-dependent oxidoreductase, partial [Frankiaceae bacterium]|nr:SDR family NAD(P)-dependent oxidoreductase [Frankiaceae bacterium]